MAIDRIIKASQPEAEADGDFDQGAGVAVLVKDSGEKLYYIVAVNDDDVEQQFIKGRKLYVNARPSSSGTQSKWYLSNQKKGELRLVRKFRFVLHHKSGNRIIPKKVRREFRNLPYIFGKQ